MEQYDLWISSLSMDELTFVKNFILASGSLKSLATQYDVSYPTIRRRLDMIVEKIRMADCKEEDPYINTIKRMALDGKFDFDTASLLVAEYKKGGSK